MLKPRQIIGMTQSFRQTDGNVLLNPPVALKIRGTANNVKVDGVDSHNLRIHIEGDDSDLWHSLIHFEFPVQ